MNKHHSAGAAAFTLIELMVAVMIVAVLIAMIITVSSTARARAGDATCAQNLRGLASAALNWSNDHGGALPDKSYWPVYVRGRSTDPFSLHPYLGIPEAAERNLNSVLTCPRYAAKYKPYNPETNTQNSWHRTYGLNMYLFGSYKGGETSDPEEMRYTYARLSNIPAPAATAFFFDGPVTPRAGDGGAFNANFQYPEWRRTSSETPDLKGTDYIHDGGIHVVYVDGHVERITEARAIADDLKEKSNPFWGRKP